MHTTKRAAQEAGEKYYVSTHPCRKCGQAGRRYASSSNCVECAIALQTKRWELKVNGRTIKRAIGLARKSAPRGATTIIIQFKCKRGHSGPRRISNGSCLECEQERTRRRLDAGEFAELHRRYRATRIDQVREKFRKWYLDHPGAATEQSNRRKARLLKAIPRWADMKKIRAIYKLKATMSKMDGVVYHVDHIVPLRSRRVCGLHCEQNLQILTGPENMKKHNSTWPDMP